MIIGIKDVEYINKFNVKLIFDNNEEKIVDLSNHINGKIFEPLNNIDYFKKVRIDNDTETICWDNGADFSPEFLYEIGV